MIDLHCHVLPEIDDGAKDLFTAMAMLELAQRSGTTGMVATPHVIEGRCEPAWKAIVSRCQELKSEAQEQGISLQLYPGAEVAMSLDNLDLFSKPGPYCVNSGNYALIELPAFEIPSYTLDFFFTLLARGITPILAHPERQAQLSKQPELIVDWVRRGILVQVNAGSLLGKFGERAQATALLLLDNNLVHCLGSDAHSARTRNPNLSGAANMLAERSGQAMAQALFDINPRKIINGEKVAVPTVDQLTYPRPRSWWRQMFSWICP